MLSLCIKQRKLALWWDSKNQELFGVIVRVLMWCWAGIMNPLRWGLQGVEAVSAKYSVYIVYILSWDHLRLSKAFNMFKVLQYIDIVKHFDSPVS